jgi:hypothetical protein
MTVLTPSYHAEQYSPDDNRHDLRQFLCKFSSFLVAFHGRLMVSSQILPSHGRTKRWRTVSNSGNLGDGLPARLRRRTSKRTDEIGIKWGFVVNSFYDINVLTID